MPRKLSETRISDVKAGNGLMLHVAWWTGDSDDINLEGELDHPVFARVCSDRNYFKQVRVGEYGAYIFWDDDADMSGADLADLAKVQSARWFKSWMGENRLTYDQAAKALGVARRTIGKYAGAEVKIPKAIKLACKAISHGLAA